MNPFEKPPRKVLPFSRKESAPQEPDTPPVDHEELIDFAAAKTQRAPNQNNPILEHLSDRYVDHRSCPEDFALYLEQPKSPLPECTQYIRGVLIERKSASQHISLATAAQELDTELLTDCALSGMTKDDFHLLKKLPKAEADACLEKAYAKAMAQYGSQFPFASPTLFHAFIELDALFAKQQVPAAPASQKFSLQSLATFFKNLFS